MNEFIHSVKAIFSSDVHDGCLGLHNVSCYYIGPYQRGYKWASQNKFDQVPQLLVDLYNAYCSKTKEYFLQYITVKKTKLKDDYVLEVIDGQQRLTTLSILFDRISRLGIGENISEDKLIYSRYDHIDIFRAVNDRIRCDISSDDQIEQQDLYYMVKAGRCIDTFFGIMKDNSEVNQKSFVNFILNNVKIIFNTENSFVESEEVFANLNDNKVSLTNAYLIKGLLLTKAARRTNEFGRSYNYKDILDQRTIMGRAWDEMNSWIEQEMVSYYFFKTKQNGMEKMLELVESIKCKDHSGNEVIKKFIDNLRNNDSKSSNYKLFNQFNDGIKTAADAVKVLAEIKHIYRKLRSIYDNIEDCQLYNLLGYRRFSIYENFPLRQVINMPTHELEKMLKKDIIAIIPDPNTQQEELRYKSQNNKLTNLLLAYSVFPENPNPHYRFDFYQYAANESWSFEHISPQNLEEEIRIDECAKEWVCEAIKTNINVEEVKERLLKKIANDEKIPVASIEFLYGDDIEDVHTLGNMALLSGGVNSALSNNPFIAKRRILFEKINSGNFVPKHTIDIFSKVLNSQGGKSFTPDFVRWNKGDIDAHLSWMQNRYNEMIKNFKKYLS